MAQRSFALFVSLLILLSTFGASTAQEFDRVKVRFIVWEHPTLTKEAKKLVAEMKARGEDDSTDDTLSARLNEIVFAGWRNGHHKTVDTGVLLTYSYTERSEVVSRGVLTKFNTGVTYADVLIPNTLFLDPDFVIKVVPTVSDGCTMIHPKPKPKGRGYLNVWGRHVKKLIDTNNLPANTHFFFDC
jgi:hypothetical protein